MRGERLPNQGADGTLTTGGNPRDGTPLLKLSSPEYMQTAAQRKLRGLVIFDIKVVRLSFAWVLLRTYRGFCFISFDAAK